MRPTPGTILLGKYRITRRMGGGGMGEVFEARHERLAGRYAIKFLSEGSVENAEALERFRREALITSRLKHPGIVQVFDFDRTPDGSPFLVMEYLAGADLAANLQNSGRLKPAEVVLVIDQIASALAVAHLKGIVHRDLKPQNIFVLPREGAQPVRTKILDFGIAKIRSESQQLTGTSTVMGTPQYMAPEQALGRVSEIDARTDQFALGAIAYELLEGRPAFVGESLPMVAYQIVHGAPAPLTSLRGRLQRDVSAVISRAMSKQKEARFPSVTDFADAFKRAIAPGMEEPSAHVGQNLAGGPSHETSHASTPDSARFFGEVWRVLRTKRPFSIPGRGRALMLGAGAGLVMLGIVGILSRSPSRPAAGDSSRSSPMARIESDPSKRFHVFVKSEPPGADIFLDGEVLGATPVMLPIDLNGKTTVKIILRKEGYEDYEQRVINEMPVSITLKKREPPAEVPVSPAPTPAVGASTDTKNVAASQHHSVPVPRRRTRPTIEGIEIR